MEPQRVEFTARDGTILRGDFYKAKGDNVPGIALATGFGLLKDNVRTFAEVCRDAGMSVLAFDFKGFGSSEGMPRQEVSFYQQGRDTQDAVTALRKLPGVDKNKVLIGGVGHGGAAALVGGSSDIRIQGLILVSPWPYSADDIRRFPPGTLERAFEELEQRSADTKVEPIYHKAWQDWEKGEKGDENSVLLTGHIAAGIAKATELASKKNGTPWKNEVTLQSFLNMYGFDSFDYAKRVKVPTFYAFQDRGDLSQPAACHYKTIGQFNNNLEVFEIPLPESENVGEQNRNGFIRAMDWYKRTF